MLPRNILFSDIRQIRLPRKRIFSCSPRGRSEWLSSNLARLSSPLCLPARTPAAIPQRFSPPIPNPQFAIRNSLNPNPPILEIRNLSIRRDATRILDGITWTLERGQHWVILGANGSGKTSLLSALTGYLSPTTGDVTVLGQTFGESDWRELRTRVGLVSSSVRQMMADHEPALTTVISGKYAMIDYWGRVKREDRAAASRILKRIEAAHLARRPWLVLSQGERQRILIGRALMARPRLLILDEPCAGLDPVARENFLAFLQRLGSRLGAPAMILVTHHVEEIAPVFSHALLLRGGRVLACGEKDTVLTSANLSQAFGASLHLVQDKERYTLQITSHSSTSII